MKWISRNFSSKSLLLHQITQNFSSLPPAFYTHRYFFVSVNVVCLVKFLVTPTLFNGSQVLLLPSPFICFQCGRSQMDNGRKGRKGRRRKGGRWRRGCGRRFFIGANDIYYVSGDCRRKPAPLKDRKLFRAK